MQDKIIMERAIELALISEQEGNLPVGAVITFGGEIIAEGRSKIWVPRPDATRHAEMETLRSLDPDLWPLTTEMSLYTTLEPCLMCLGSILHHTVGRVVFGASDVLNGSSSVLTHLPPNLQEIFNHTQWMGPIMPDKCGQLYQRLMAILEKEGGWNKNNEG
ncbi:MAG: nucleoside deaminase [Saprospiraceae bacterium]|nr:nucleoside deaminase [Saprospiraceae bacterium]